jgi:DNA-binding NarL/FixJ family response regulator
LLPDPEIPAPGLSDLTELVETVRAAGTPVSLRTTGSGRRLSRPQPPGRQSDLGQLTEREREVLLLVAQGLSNGELAGVLRVSIPAVKTHVSRVLTKLGARDRAQLVVIAYESGLVTTA